MKFIEKYSSLIQYVAILTAFLIPMLLAAKLYYILKTKQYSKSNLLTSAAYLVSTIIAYVMLNNAQRLYLAVYLGLLLILVLIIIITSRILRK